METGLRPIALSAATGLMPLDVIQRLKRRFPEAFKNESSSGIAMRAVDMGSRQFEEPVQPI